MSKLEHLKQLLQTIPSLELAVLVGRRASVTATEQSDWDFAIRWEKHINSWLLLDHAEKLKQQIYDTVGIHKDKIAPIDMAYARLAMRAVITEEGTVFKGSDSLAWSHFLTQTWGELEDYCWRQNNAA